MGNTRFKNRDDFTREIEEQLALDTLPKLSKALLNKHHPLFKNMISQLQHLSLDDSDEVERRLCESAIQSIMSIPAERAKYEQAIKDAMSAEELVEARIRSRDMQAQLLKREQSAALHALTLEEIVQGCEDANAWIKAEKQNIKRVSADIAALNHKIEEANAAWAAVEQETKERMVDTFIKENNHAVVIEMEGPENDV